MVDAGPPRRLCCPPCPVTLEDLTVHGGYNCSSRTSVFLKDLDVLDGFRLPYRTTVSLEFPIFLVELDAFCGSKSVQ